MRDNPDTNPETLFASGADPRNLVLNVSKQESLGLITSGVAPGMSGDGGKVDASGWVNFVTGGEAVQIPGQYSESPVFVGGGGSVAVTPNPTLPVGGGVGGGVGGVGGGGGYISGGGGIRGSGRFEDPDDPFSGGFSL